MNTGTTIILFIGYFVVVAFFILIQELRAKLRSDRRTPIPQPKNQDKRPPRELDIEYIKTVCKSKQPSETCRYLFCGPKGFECGKIGMMRKICDEKAMRGQTFALGDNCGGPL